MPKSKKEKGSKPIIGYCRVSTRLQTTGQEAQKEAILAYSKAQEAPVLAFYVDRESGKDSDRAGLMAAIQTAQEKGACLVIAKLDRLSRDTEFIFSLRRAGVDFLALDLPDFNPLTLSIFAGLAQHERGLISERTKAGLAIARAKGLIGGNPNGVSPAARRAGLQKRKELAISRTIDAAKVTAIFLRDGLSLREIARRLAEIGVPTARGGQWSAQAVKSLIQTHGLRKEEDKNGMDG